MNQFLFSLLVQEQVRTQQRQGRKPPFYFIISSVPWRSAESCLNQAATFFDVTEFTMVANSGPYSHTSNVGLHYIQPTNRSIHN